MTNPAPPPIHEVNGREDSDFTAIQERLRQVAASQQAKDATPADPATTQPADLLPFIGGEHANAPKGIAFTLPDYLELVDWTGRATRDPIRVHSRLMTF